MKNTDETHFVGKIAQKALIVRSDGAVLITRDVRDEVWELPGGRLNLGENPAAGLARELREELGAECVVEQVFAIEQAHHAQDNQAALFLIYKVSLQDESVNLSVDPVEVAELAWVKQETWHHYKYFSEYEMALANYFKNL